MSTLSSYKLEMQFNDVDHFTDMVRAWDLDFWQLERGSFYANLSQVGIGRFQLGKAEFNRKLHQFGLSPAGGLTFVVPNQQQLNLLWRGHRIQPSQLMCFPEDRGLESVSDASFDIHTLTIQQSDLERRADQLELGSVSSLFRGNDVCVVDPRLLLVLRFQLNRIHALDDADLVEQAKHIQSELDVLVGYILQAWSASSGHQVRGRSVARGQLLEQVRRYIDQHARQPIRISELCQHVGVSERTLQYAFQGEYECTPKQYLTKRRLHGVRKAIRGAPAAAIAEIAKLWGFWHLGQFAADYKRLFGERPSETARRLRVGSQKSPIG